MTCNSQKLALMLAAVCLLVGSSALAGSPQRAKTAAETQVQDAKAQPPSVLEQLDDAMAAKCSCGSQADCTCKKGQCECKKCHGHRRVRMIESLKGEPSPLKLPQNARNDASAGVFI
jgi:hypothetical protein